MTYHYIMFLLNMLCCAFCVGQYVHNRNPWFAALTVLFSFLALHKLMIILVWRLAEAADNARIVVDSTPT